MYSSEKGPPPPSDVAGADAAAELWVPRGRQGDGRRRRMAAERKAAEKHGDGGPFGRRDRGGGMFGNGQVGDPARMLALVAGWEARA
mmetsp:Transcript_2042/g.4460  ORF Transcript_2042/g.4460 Transcript_2042/m.4460 type:complete len:87 (-) Transcript_2042:3-263(-)